jgi:hypothetical protein
MSSPPQIELGRELAEQLTIHKNIGQEIVVTTVDKVRICLMETRDSLAAKDDWAAPLALLVSLITTLIAADFKNAGLQAATWQAIYVIGVVLSALWLIRTGRRSYQYRGTGSIDSIVGRLKSDTAAQVGAVSTEPRDDDQLRIVSAEYGANGKFVELTEILRARIVGGALDVLVSNDLGGDPCRGVPKALTVKYTVRGETKTATVAEDQRLRI